MKTGASMDQSDGTHREGREGGEPSARRVLSVGHPHESHKDAEREKARRSFDRKAGFTLVEVLLTAMILGVGMTVLLSCLTTCLRTMAVARDYEQVNWAFGLGELTYPDPLDPSTDVKKDYTVEPDASLVEGFIFERVVDDKDEELAKKDPLYVVRTRVVWGEGSGAERPHEEIVRYVWQRSK